MNTLISVVIPVFNAERYLRDCIESILNQTHTSLEVILINDGSTDKSLEVILELKEKDSRIIFLEQENQGVSVARNNGLSRATGEFVAFVDADDWLEKDFVEKLVTTILEENVDVVITNFISYLGGKETVFKYPFPANKYLNYDDVKEIIYPRFVTNDDLNSACNKLFKTSIIQAHNIHFPPGNALAEDNLFNLNYFRYVRSAYYLDYAGYHYRENMGSATRNFLKHDYFQNLLKIRNIDFQNFFELTFSTNELEQLKDKKFVESVMALMHHLIQTKGQISLNKKYKLISHWVNHDHFISSLKNVWNELFEESGAYRKLLLYAIRFKSSILILLLVYYSIFRNR